MLIEKYYLYSLVENGLSDARGGTPNADSREPNRGFDFDICVSIMN